MSGTSIGPVIDYLVATTLALPACASPVLVSDGFNAFLPDSTLVLIGATDESGEIPCTLKFGAIGPRSTSEEFEIPCGIYAHTGSSTQKTVRDQVNTIFNAIIAFILADPSLGGNLGPTAGAGVASISGGPLIQTNVPVKAASGRSAFRLFTVKCVAYFPPS